MGFVYFMSLCSTHALVPEIRRTKPRSRAAAAAAVATAVAQLYVPNATRRKQDRKKHSHTQKKGESFFFE